MNNSPSLSSLETPWTCLQIGVILAKNVFLKLVNHFYSQNTALDISLFLIHSITTKINGFSTRNSFIYFGLMYLRMPYNGNSVITVDSTAFKEKFNMGFNRAVHHSILSVIIKY